MRVIIILLCLCSILHGREATDKPNVIIFFLDDSGYGDFAHNGNPTIKTPNITKMVREGINFTQFYVTSPACSASRYSLLTGRFPLRSGLGSWVIGPGSARHIHPKEVTIAEGLKKIGYKTGMFGKWHLGSPNAKNKNTDQTLPLAHGFDQWIGTNVSHDYGNAMLMKSDPKGTTPIKGYTILAKNLPSDDKASASLTGLCTKGAVKFIGENKDKPFFAYIALNMPHLGLYVSEKFKGKSRRGLLGDVMEEIDDCVKQVRAKVKECGIEKNTIIIFSSDNGPWVLFRNTKKHGKYGEARMHVGYAFPFYDGKGSTWEGGHRVPGIFVWPGQFPKGAAVQKPASTLDILPTIFKLTGAELPKDRTLDGRDIRSYLTQGEKAKEMEFKLLYSHGRNTPNAIRKGPWKMHIKLGSQIGKRKGFEATREKPLLFQVEHDLHESFDRASEKPEVLKDLQKELLKLEEQIKKEGTFWDKKDS